MELKCGHVYTGTEKMLVGRRLLCQKCGKFVKVIANKKNNKQKRSD